jgi:hypothetical protein
MSKATKWVIAVLVIAAVILGLWWSGILGSSTSKVNNAQEAATAMSGSDQTPALETSDAIIAEEAAAITAQMKVVGNQFATFGQTPTASKGNLLAGQLSAVTSLMQKIADRFQARITTLKSAGFNVETMQSAVSNMNLQISYARSVVGQGGQTIAKITFDSGANQNNAALAQAKIDFQKAQTYLVASVKNIKTIIDGFKVISSSQTGL